MTHRAENILSSIQTNLTGLTTTGSNVFRGRLYDLQPTELPALIIHMGPDDPISNNEIGGATNIQFIDSLLYVVLQSHVSGIYTDAQTIETELNKIRSESHVAMRANYTQGLAYVQDTLWAGANQPNITKDGDRMAASQDLTWLIRYRSPVDSPEV